MRLWKCEIDDPRITEMEPVRKFWMYYQWLGDHRDDAELAKNHAYLLGSFWNPEAVKEMMNSNVHESSDEDLEESMRLVKDNDFLDLSFAKNTTPNDVAPSKKRKRKILKG